MKMRTFIHVKATNMSSKTAHHARYISERDRDPQREEPQTRPIFTHDQDGLKHTAADRYLASGKRATAKTNEIIHVIIAFNQHDAKELEKLASARTLSHKTQLPKIANSSLAGDSPKDELTKIGNSKLAKLQLAKSLQIERDLPFAQAVREMIANLEERTNLTELQYALAVHRHTSQTHVHLILRRQYTDKATGEKATLHRLLPRELLNDRDEKGRAQAGILDQSLSDALDKMIPARQRPSKIETLSTEPIINKEIENPDRLNEPHLSERADHKTPEVKKERIQSIRFKAPERSQPTNHTSNHHPLEPESNLQKLRNILSANLQILQIQSHTRTTENSIEKIRNNILSAEKPAPTPVPSLPQIPAHTLTATQLNSSLTERQSEEAQKRENQKRSPIRGR
jgi:hypothetical protein